MIETVFTESIWGDEGFSAILSMKSIPEIIKIISKDTSPPLYNITEHLAFQYFGVSEITIRALSLFYFLLCILFVYLIASMIWSKKTGLLAVIATTLNPFFFIYAFEGRMYSILALGVTASMYFFLRIFSFKGKQIINYIGYIFFTLWAIYSHHFAFFAIAVQGLWTIKEFFSGKRKTAWGVIKSLILVGILYVPWIIPLYKQVTMVKGGFWLGRPTLKDFGVLLFDYLGQGIKLLNFKIPFIPYKIYEIAPFAVFVTLLTRKWWKSVEKSIFFLLWFLGPILITWVISQKFTSIFFNRYLLYCIPAAMIILVSCRSKISFVPLTITLMLFLVIDINYFFTPQKLPFRQMSVYVKETIKDGDMLINWNSSAHHLWETKFYGIPAPIYISGEGELPYYVGTALMEEGDIIRTIPKNVKKVGVVTSGSFDEIALPGFKLEDKKEIGNLKFGWFIASH
jgi:uncharacterized membrane protein